MRFSWAITFSDLIVILGIMITIGLAGIILWAELTIKRRWDTLYLTKREFRRFYNKLGRQWGSTIIIFPYDSRCSVRTIVRKGSLAAGTIEKQSLPNKTRVIIFDYRHAVPVSDKSEKVIIPSSAILAEVEFSLPNTAGDNIPQDLK